MNKKILFIAIAIIMIMLYAGCVNNSDGAVISEGSQEENNIVLARGWQDQLNEAIFSNQEIQRIVFLDSMTDDVMEFNQIQEIVSHPKDGQESAKDSPNLDMWASNEDGVCTVYIAAPGGVWAPQDSSFLFANMFELQEIDFNNAFHTDNMKSMENMFSDDVKLEALDLSGFETGQVTNMKCTFLNCESLKSLDITRIDTGNVTDMYGTFCCLRGIEELDVSHLDTSRVETMEYMFDQCENIKYLDVSSFNTSNVQKMSYMFAMCTNLEDVDISGFEVSQMNDVNMEYMFLGTKIEEMGLIELP